MLINMLFVALTANWSVFSEYFRLKTSQKLRTFTLQNMQPKMHTYANCIY
ncbi:hypothetical protein THF1D04_10436 [Vibrio owensii]|uniref:Uncharacterized protein n=1 Tax=Vibrio owensii TaxID=696485 RepID=A0AAU9PXS7_9VIBR|nr:hypothetical protein THF1D04_10436 [Vibrio owensii]